MRLIGKTKMKDEVYKPVKDIVEGSKILLNYGSKNGIYTVDSVGEEKVIIKSPRGNFTYNRYVINCGKLKIMLSHPEVIEIPFVDGGFVFRRIPLKGKYLLMQSKLDCNRTSDAPKVKMMFWKPSVNIIGYNSKKAVHWNDKYTFYKTKVDEQLAQSAGKLTSHFLGYLERKEYSKGYGKSGRTVRIKVEFDYNPDCFVIPYKQQYSRTTGLLRIPDDVNVIGASALNQFQGCVITFSPKKILFKAGSLKVLNVTSTKIEYLDTRVDNLFTDASYIQINGSKTNIYHYQVGEILKGRSAASRAVYTSLRHYHIGDKITDLPGVSKRTVVLSLSDEGLQLNNGIALLKNDGGYLGNMKYIQFTLDK